MGTLIVMVCSGQKLDWPAPAIDLYRGVMYQTFRAHACEQTRSNVIILSAEHGFLDPDAVIDPCDRIMTPARSQQMLDDLPRFMGRARWPSTIRRAFLAGGMSYRRVMRAALARINGAIAIEESRGAIGQQRSQLGRYLDALSGRGKVVGRHQNGVPLYQSLGGFTVGDIVETRYLAAPHVTPRPAKVQELFNGPCGPTASIELFDGKPGRQPARRWIGLEDIRAVPSGQGSGAEGTA